MNDQSPASAADLSSLLAALSDATRRRIVARLARTGEQPCSAFLDCASKTNLSYHFAKLREASVITHRQSGTSRIISLRKTELEARFPGLVAAILAADQTERPTGD